MAGRVKQIILTIAVFLAGVAVGCGVTYMYFMSLMFDVQNQIR